jgi:zona occludens toxin
MSLATNLYGKRGGGKSFTMVKDYLIPAILSGRHVYTNLPVKIDKLMEITPQARRLVHIVGFKPEWFKWVESICPEGELGYEAPITEAAQELWWTMGRPGEGPLMLVDEAHKCFPAGQNATPRHVCDWFGLSRHYGVTYVLASQRMRKVNLDLRELADETVQVKSTIGVWFKRPDLIGKRTYARMVFEGHEVKIGQNPDDSHYGWYDPQWYQYYDSHTRGGAAVAEKRTEGGRKFKKYAVALVLLGLYLAFVGLPGGSPDAPPPAVQTAMSPQIGATTVAAAQSPAPVASAVSPIHPLKGRRVDVGMVGVWATGEWSPIIYIDGRKTHSAALEAMGYTLRVLDGHTLLIAHGNEVWSAEVGTASRL